MRIKEVTNNEIIFDNGNKITCWCDEFTYANNYADFSQIDDLAKDMDFDEDLIFEAVDICGFRFGNMNKNNMTFVPCYSEQNGYYSNILNIDYNGKQVAIVECEIGYN